MGAITEGGIALGKGIRERRERKEKKTRLSGLISTIGDLEKSTAAGDIEGASSKLESIFSSATDLDELTDVFTILKSTQQLPVQELKAKIARGDTEGLSEEQLKLGGAFIDPIQKAINEQLAGQFGLLGDTTSKSKKKKTQVTTGIEEETNSVTGFINRILGF